MQRRTMIGLGVLAAVIATLAALGLREPARSVALGEVRRARFVQSFVEEGKTRLRQRYSIAAPFAGSVGRIDIEPGDAVKAGALLATLAPAVGGLLEPGARARVNAEAAAAAASARAAHERAAAARSAQQLSARERERYADLSGRGLVPVAQSDAANSAARQAEAELAAALAEEQAAEQRRAAVAAVLGGEGQGGGASLPLLAPADGVVLRRWQESAGPVQAGQPLLEVGDPSQLEIEVEALSTDAVALRPGMAANILRWGGPEALAATVTRIEPGGFTKVSALGVEEQRTRVILEFSVPRERWLTLGDGFRVEVEFVLFDGADVLQVPSAALYRGDGGWRAYVVDGQRARGAVVEIGARSGAATVVQSGLQAGQQVVLDPDDQIHDGSRLAPLAH